MSIDECMTDKQQTKLQMSIDETLHESNAPDKITNVYQGGAFPFNTDEENERHKVIKTETLIHDQ